MTRQHRSVCLAIGLCAVGMVSRAAGSSPNSEEFDALENWEVNREGAATVRDGALVASSVTMHKTFSVDLDRYSRFEIKVDEAAGNYVIKASFLGKPHVDLVRTGKPGVFRNTIPLQGSGETKVVIHLFLPEGENRIDYVRFLPPVTRSGGPPPAGAAALAPPSDTSDLSDNSWDLVNGDISLAIWKANGCVAGGWNGQNSEKVFGFCQDLYRIETLKDQIEAFELRDEVDRSRLLDDGRHLELYCTNPDLPGVEIKKDYRLRAESNIISKRVAFQADRDWQGVIHWISDVRLAPDFREGGFYNNRDYHPLKHAFVYAKDVRVPKRQPEGQQVYFTSPRKGATAASYRIRVNDRIVGPWCYFTPKGTSAAEAETDQYYTAEGWQFKAHVDLLKPGYRPSAEVHYCIVPGDFSNFHRLVMALPETAEINRMVAPDWVREVKGSGLPPIPERTSPEQLQAWDQLLDEGYATVGQHFGAANPHASGWNAEGPTEEDAEMLRRMVAHVRRNSTRLKVGAYAWLHSNAEDSWSFQHHPEWYLRGPDGNHVVDNAGLYSRLLVPEHIQYVREKIRSLMTDFDLDYFYVDGGGFGRTDVDWPTLRVVHPYDYGEMYEGTRVDGKPSFFNAINVLRGYYNAMGYFEGFIEVENWRALTIKLYEVKLNQLSGTWSMPLYLRPNNRQRFTNYCTLFGLKPAAAVYREHLPMLNMAYELCEFFLRDAGVTPTWWLEESELEAYALGPSDRNEFCITLLSHEKEQETFPVGFDVAKTGLQPDAETYVLHYRTEKATVLWQNRLSEPEDRILYETEGWSPIALPLMEPVRTYPSAHEAAKMELVVRPELAEVVGITQVPGLIWSVNGHRKYFPFSATRWGTVTGAREGDRVSLLATCVQHGEVAVIVPDAWNNVEAEVDGEPVPHRWAWPNLCLVPIPEGDHRIEVRRRPVAETVNLVVSSPEKVERGQTASFHLVAKTTLPADARAQVTISRGINPVFTGHGVAFAAGKQTLPIQVPIPKSVMPGDYIVRVGLDGVTTEGRRVSEHSLQIEIDSIVVPEDWAARSNAVETVTDFDESIPYGHDPVEYRVLRTYQQTYNGNPGNDAIVNTRSTWNHFWSPTVDAGMGEERIAGYAHAGVEMDDLRALSVNIAFNRPPRVDGGEVFAQHPDAHVSFSADFHTPAGYTKRVYFHANKVNKTFGARTKPWWGTAAALETVEPEVQHEYFRNAVEYKKAQWDLADYAPKDWDGRVILGSNVSMAVPTTRLFLRILPKQKFSEGSAGEHRGPESAWGNITYRKLDPIAKGARAKTSLEESAMRFKAVSGDPDGYALVGINEWNLLIPRIKVKASGNSFVVADYLSVSGTKKRVFAILSGEDADAVSEKLKAIGKLDKVDEPIEVIDLRKEIAASPDRYDFGLGKYAPKDWHQKTKRCLFRVGALGPDGSIELTILENDDFWRF